MIEGSGVIDFQARRPESVLNLHNGQGQFLKSRSRGKQTSLSSCWAFNAPGFAPERRSRRGKHGSGKE